MKREILLGRAACRAGLLGAAIVAYGCSPAPIAPAPQPVIPAPSPVRPSPPTVVAPVLTSREALARLIDSLISQPKFRTAEFGVLIVNPRTGDTLFSHNAGKLFLPASNMKILTGSIALKQL